VTRSKYGNTPVTIDGMRFRSKREAARFQELRLLERAGEIAGLAREVPFILAPRAQINGRWRPALTYIADSVYSTKDGRMVVEDCKGVRTEGYRIKRHLMKSVHGIDILET